MPFKRTRGSPRAEETKRVGRVLAIAQLIAAQPRCWSRRKLAARFEVSPRTLDNDLQMIRHALVYDLRRGGGGYYFAEVPSIKPLHFSLPEVLALVLAAQHARAVGAVDPGVAAGAMARLEEVVPAGILPYLRRSHALLSSTSEPVRERGSALATLERAVLERRKVRLTYRTAQRHDAVSERVLAPYGLLWHERAWYVIGHDSMRDMARTFKIDRVVSSSLIDDQYELPRDFDLTAYLSPTWGLLHTPEIVTENVVLRFSSRAAPWVRDERWHPSQQSEVLADGDLRLHFTCSVTHELVRWVLSFGGEVRVEEPEHLRHDVEEAARQILSTSAGRLVAEPGTEE
jgi:predicted DNA-binding transcriptional regulator YafY